LGCLGPQEAGGPMQVPAAWAAKARMGMFLHWRLHAPHALAQQSTGASCSYLCAHSGALASRTSEHATCKRMHQAWAAWRRPGGLVFSAAMGGPCPLSYLCLPSFRAGLPSGLSRRGRPSAILERSTGRHLDFLAWPARPLALLSPMAGWRRLPPSLELLDCPGGGNALAQRGGVAC
jgi:hypothetical protein